MMVNQKYLLLFLPSFCLLLRRQYEFVTSSQNFPSNINEQTGTGRTLYIKLLRKFRTLLIAAAVVRGKWASIIVLRTTFFARWTGIMNISTHAHWPVTNATFVVRQSFGLNCKSFNILTYNKKLVSSVRFVHKKFMGANPEPP